MQHPDLFGETSKKKAERNAKGHFIKGNPTLCSRKKLPEWFRESGEKALRTLSAAATGESMAGDNEVQKGLAKFCEDQYRIKAAQIVVERVFGKVKEQKESLLEDDEFSAVTEKQNQIKLLETALLKAANDGDINAAKTMLAALDPARYSNRKIEPEDDNETVDGVEWAS